MDRRNDTKLTKEDKEKISGYLSNIQVELALNYTNYVLPFLSFNKSCEKNSNIRENDFYHTHLHSHQLQDRSKFRTLFDSVNGMGSITVKKRNKYYLFEKTFHIGNRYCLLDNLEEMGIERFEIESTKRELFFPTLDQVILLARQLTEKFNNGKEFEEIDYRKPGKVYSLNHDSDLLVHLFYSTVLISKIIDKPESLFYSSSIIRLKPVKTRTFEEVMLLEDILKFHEFFESLKLK